MDVMAEQHLFTAYLDDVTTMSKILHELNQADDHCILVIKSEGIRLITAGEKVFQVSAYFACSTFQRYELNAVDHNQVNFKFVLKDFIESLNLLRDDPVVEGDKVQLIEEDQLKTSLLIEYKRKGQPLKLKLENNTNYEIECGLKAFYLPSDSFCPLIHSEFEETAVILLNSKRFYDYVSGLDFVSSEFVHLIMTKGEIPLKLITSSPVFGDVDLEITQNESEIIKSEIVAQDGIVFSFRYRTQFMKPALESLKNSCSTQITIGGNGLLNIEHFLKSDESTSAARHHRPSHPYESATTTATDYKSSSLEYFILSEVSDEDEEIYNVGGGVGLGTATSCGLKYSAVGRRPPSSSRHSLSYR